MVKLEPFEEGNWERDCALVAVNNCRGTAGIHGDCPEQPRLCGYQTYFPNGATCFDLFKIILRSTE